MEWIIYKTTNKINHKIYLGVHKNPNKDKFDGYLGSGILLKKAIRKYGKENFIRETLFSFEDKQEAYKKENELVDISFVLDRTNYNLHIGGHGSGFYVNENGWVKGMYKH